MSKVIVVGGGAAGMIAAVIAGRNGNDVTLVEKNEKLGKKLFITGKGRCNVTNAADVETLLNNVVTNKKFLYSSFYGFDNAQLMDLIEAAGCPLKTERGDRVFPVSDHSSDIIKAFEKMLNDAGVKVMLRTEVKSILTADNIAEGLSNIEVVNTGDTQTESVSVKEAKAKSESADKKKAIVTGILLSSGKRLTSDAVIVATGGITYPLTGSTGDGHKFAREMGHTVTKLNPSLVPLETKEKWVKDVMGLALKNVNLTIKKGSKEIYDGFGEMLFTHFGISGPLVLTGSCYYDAERDEDVKAYIDLKPALSVEQLDKRLLKDFDENANKQVLNGLAGLLPSKLLPIVIEYAGINPEKKINTVSKTERENLIKTLKALELNITGTRGPAEAIITRGGVSVKEIDPGTMESKKVSNLYFAGEVLDLDAVTGGFNLQIAWSTGYAAGNAV